jgi:hypothetical protein
MSFDFGNKTKLLIMGPLRFCFVNLKEIFKVHISITNVFFDNYYIFSDKLTPLKHSTAQHLNATYFKNQCHIYSKNAFRL